MKICPECKSDMLESNKSTALRVIAAVILLFIPFGLFFVWVPFVFPYSYTCKNCGQKVETPEEMDWREFDKLKQSQYTNAAVDQEQNPVKAGEGQNTGSDTGEEQNTAPTKEREQ